MVLMATKRMLGSDWLTVMSLGQLGSSVNDRHVLNSWYDTGQQLLGPIAKTAWISESE